MTIVAEWLPENAINKQHIEGYVSSALNKWAGNWIDGNIDVSVEEQQADISDHIRCGNIIWGDFENGCIILTGKNFPERFIFDVISGKAKTDPTLSDKFLSQRVWDKAASSIQETMALSHSLDLECGRVEHEALKSADSNAWRCINIKIRSTSLSFKLLLSRSFLIGCRKRELKICDISTPMQSIAHAIGKETVMVGAKIGYAKAKLSDVKTLGLGDIILVNSSISEPLHVTLNGVILYGVKCKLNIDSDKNTLIMHVNSEA